MTDMYGMFYFAGQFNQTLGAWNVTRVTNMAMMFRSGRFNQALGAWSVMTNMYGMFQRASSSTRLWGMGRVQSDEHGVHV